SGVPMMRLLFVFLPLVMGLCCAAHAMEFVHPGGLCSKAELDFVKAQIEKGAEPWKGEFDRLKESGAASRGPHGLDFVHSEREDADVLRDDSIAAYGQALLWYFSGEEVYGQRSVAILNSWSTLKGFTTGTDQDCLQAGWSGAVLGQAAELMRGYAGWRSDDLEAFQLMLRRAFYPKLRRMSTWNGNVDLTQIDAMMVLSVFNEDAELFQEAVERLKVRSKAYFYLKEDGLLPSGIAGDGDDVEKFWGNPLKWVDGLTQETCRDNGHHAQFGIGSAIHAAEVAWHQGVDVYAENEKRFTAAMELLASQFLAGSMGGVSRDDVPSESRFDAWEMGYHHYHGRRGIELPNTRRLIAEQVRPRAERAVCNLVYDMLTHVDLPEGK
ncbi:alginate lyase family protein, partial [Akkermansiaceae bacterium]|nr:alginate lyase family protein [Akkermansiaceae bacterium]